MYDSLLWMYKCINTDEYGYEMCTMSTHNPKKRVQNMLYILSGRSIG